MKFAIFLWKLRAITNVVLFVVVFFQNFGLEYSEKDKYFEKWLIG